MKIKNIAAICKKNKYAVIYERYGESGGVIQYIGDGAAAYPVTGLPKLDKESLLTIFDVPEKQRKSGSFAGGFASQTTKGTRAIPRPSLLW